MKKKVFGLSILVLAILVFSTFYCTKLDINPDSQGVATGGVMSQVTGFGTNPGSLAMYKFVPTTPNSSPGLVVVMHGCTQSASEYATRSEWNKVAEKYGFYVVHVEQNSSNNSTKCFNWFEPGDIVRGQGEALSIKQMVDKMKADYSAIDSTRVFVTGFSAGGAMTPVMMAAYPDVFAGGAVNAGVPYKCATTMTNAFSCMSPGVDKTPDQWKSLVTGAYSGYSGAYPTLLVFQGSSDTTVKELNMTELVDQWTAVHNTDQVADTTTTLAGHEVKEYKDSTGKVVVKTYRIASMGHAITVDPGTAVNQGGSTGGYAEDRNIYSVYYAAQFWGLTNEAPPAPVVSISPGTCTFTNSFSAIISATNNPTVIKYSYDGTNWSDYTGSITISSTKTIYAKAANENGTNWSSVVNATYTWVSGPVPVTTITPNGATFETSVNVTITATNTPTSIQYSFDNSNWTTGSSVTISETKTLYARAINTHGTGNVVNAVFTKQLPYQQATDTLSGHQAAGRFADDSGAWQNDLYMAAGTSVSWSSTATLTLYKAQGATKWQLEVPTGETPVQKPVVSISPNGGTFTSAQNVTISATNSPTSVQYSFDNRTWTTYTAAFSVSSSKTVYARATNAGGTGTAQAVFTINTASVPVVTLSPNGGTFTSAQNVAVNATNDPTSIQYSFDNTNWTAYVAPFQVSASTTVYARATNSAGTGTTQAVFTINTGTFTCKQWYATNYYHYYYGRATRTSTAGYKTVGGGDYLGSYYTGTYTYTTVKEVSSGVFKIGACN